MHGSGIDRAALFPAELGNADGSMQKTQYAELVAAERPLILA